MSGPFTCRCAVYTDAGETLNVDMVRNIYVVLHMYYIDRSKSELVLGCVGRENILSSSGSYRVPVEVGIDISHQVDSCLLLSLIPFHCCLLSFSL